MAKSLDKQIEQLLLYLRSKDPNIRYKALHKLKSILFLKDFEEFQNIIVQNLSKYSANDPNPKIRSDAKNIIATYDGTFNPKIKKNLKLHLKIFLIVIFLGLIAILVLYLNLPDNKNNAKIPETKIGTNVERINIKGDKEKIDSQAEKSKIIENNKTFSLKYKMNKNFRDVLDVEITNKVIFKKQPLFTNTIFLKIERLIERVNKDESFLMSQKVIQASGVTTDLHNFGYPNPGEKLLITYLSSGTIKSILSGNTKLSEEVFNKFAKFKNPQRELSIGETWDEVNSSVKNSIYKFNNVMYAGDVKLFQILYKYNSIELSNFRRIAKNEINSEIYLDYITRIPLFLKTNTISINNSKTTSVSLDNEITIVETSSNLDKLNLKNFLSEHIKTGLLKLEEGFSETQERGVVH